MTRPHRQRTYFTLGLALGLIVLVGGCAATRSSLFGGSSDDAGLAGKWTWDQGLGDLSLGVLWHGEFVLEKDGASYTGTLDDVREGTYGDIVRDVTLSDDQIAFTRDGRFGIQYWQGTLTEEDGVLKIVDGKWSKEGGPSGTWSAEKVD